jgi:hypothetical protein
MSQGRKVTALGNLAQTDSDDIMYVVDNTDTVSKKVELQNLLYDNMVTPAKLSTGAPNWNSTGTLTTGGSVFTGGESVEINYWGSGVRNAYIDFHSQGVFGDNGYDYDARLFRYPGVDGKFELSNNGTGPITVDRTIDQITDDKSIVTKEYVDGTYELNENGYIKLPSGLIMQWGSMTPTVQETEVDLPITFPNACFNVQTSIGANFTDESSSTSYEDNSLIWGGYPISGDLSKIIIMSNLRVRQNLVRNQKIFWQAIGN